MPAPRARPARPLRGTGGPNARGYGALPIGGAVPTRRLSQSSQPPRGSAHAKTLVATAESSSASSPRCSLQMPRSQEPAGARERRRARPSCLLDTTRLVRSWLEEGVTSLPDRVLDAVLDQFPATPQRRSWWPARRFGTLNSYTRIALAVAAVLVVAVVGYNLLPGNVNVGGPATPIPTLSPEPTPITFAPPDLGRPVAGGRYAFEVGSPGNGRYFPVELTLPSGWIPQKLIGDDVDLVGPGADGLFLGFFVVGRVYRDPCHPELGYAGGYLGPSNTRDLVNELRGLAGFEAGVSSTVQIRWIERRLVVTGGDLQATHFVISNTINTETAGCTDGALLPLFSTMTAGHEWRHGAGSLDCGQGRPPSAPHHRRGWQQDRGWPRDSRRDRRVDHNRFDRRRVERQPAVVVVARAGGASLRRHFPRVRASVRE